MKLNPLTSIFPLQHSIINPNQSIIIAFKYKLQKTNFKELIGFDRYTSGKVKLSRDGKTITIDNLNSSNANILISVGNIISSNKKYQSERFDLRFMYSKETLTKKTFSGYSILHRRKIVLPLTSFKGEIFKIEDKRGKTKTIAIDQNEKIFEYNKLIQQEGKLHNKKYGKLHPTLFKYLEKRKSNELIPVALWFNDKRRDFDKAKMSVEQLDKLWEKDKIKQNKILGDFRKSAKKLSDKYKFKLTKLRNGAPVIEGIIPKKNIAELSKEKELNIIFLKEKGGVDDLNNAMSVANADDVINIYGYTGTGVNVAVFEEGPTSTTNINVTDFFDDLQINRSNHAMNVIGIIQNTFAGTANGFAPNCRMHSANSYDLDSFDWALDERCSVINQSFHRSSEETSSGLSFDDIYKDYKAYHFPFPTIIQAAGNSSTPGTEYVNHKGFNSISIGNHDDTGNSMSSSSVYRNPGSPHSDRELPELSANGTRFTIFAGGAGSGTSYSSPAVAGTAALLQEANSILRFWPEGVRALLLAGAKRNITGRTWWNDVIANVDAKDGAGALDALESIKICRNKKIRNNVASIRGWDTGTLTNSNFLANGLTNFEYRLKVPTSFFPWSTTRKVKVALCWSNEVLKILSFYFENQVNVDLDLRVYNSAGVQVASSSSWDNSYEIAEFDGNVGEEYTIKIKRWSGTDKTYYGLAWTAGDYISLVRSPGTVFELG